MAHGPEQERVEHQGRFAGAVGQRPGGAEQQQVDPQARLALLGHQPVRGLQDRAAAGVGRPVRDDRRRERVDGLGLGDHVERAPGVALDVDVVERLQPGAPPRPGAAHALATTRILPC